MDQIIKFFRDGLEVFWPKPKKTVKKKKKATAYELPRKEEVDPELEAMKEKIRRDLLKLKLQSYNLKLEAL